MNHPRLSAPRPSSLRRAAALASIAAIASLVAGPARSDDTGKDGFNRRCAICHQAKGEGVPGSFPPLHAQVATFAGTKAGRDYLIAVITYGRNGGLVMNGATYKGFMPPQGLSDAEAAAVLNYVVGTIAGGNASVANFSSAEVAEVRGRVPFGAEAAAAMRPTSP
jgi:nitrite reductase (NO-forming)